MLRTSVLHQIQEHNKVKRLQRWSKQSKVQAKKQEGHLTSAVFPLHCKRIHQKHFYSSYAKSHCYRTGFQELVQGIWNEITEGWVGQYQQKALTRTDWEVKGWNEELFNDKQAKTRSS